MPTPSQVAARLTRFSMRALETGAALDAKTHVVVNQGHHAALVSWASDEPLEPEALSIEDIDTYLYFLRKGHFSVVTMDGAIIQVSVRIHRGSVGWHRFCYIPCPVVFDPAELVEESLDYVVERNLASPNRKNINLRGALRFDYDPDAAAEDHPSSHMTLNFDSARIPVGRNFDALTFLTFLDKHFYANRPGVQRFEIALAGDGTDLCLSDADRSQPHMNWNI